jgi:imidazoleglycerol-phosphate dehydratase
MRSERRRVALRRRTRGTEVEVELRLDGSGRTAIETPFGLLNDLLHLLAAQSGLDLRLVQTPNRHADDNYAVDDLGTALAEAFRRAVGMRPRIRQFGSAIVPVGDALVLAAVDLVSPPVFQFGASFQGRRLGDMDLGLVERFLATFADRLGAGLHVRVLAGEHEENRLKGIFIALGRCLSEACLEMEREGAREVAADLDYSEGLKRPPAGAAALDEAVIEEMDTAFEAEPEAEPAYVERGPERQIRLPRRGERPDRGDRGDRGRRRRESRPAYGEPPADIEAPPAEEELPVLPDFPETGDYGDFEPEGPLEPQEEGAVDGESEEDRAGRRRRRGRRGGRGRRRGPGAPESEVLPEGEVRQDRPERVERLDRAPLDRPERMDRAPLDRPERIERGAPAVRPERGDRRPPREPRGDRAGREGYRPPRRPVEDEAFVESQAAPSKHLMSDDDGWPALHHDDDYGTPPEPADPPIGEIAPRERTPFRYGRGRRGQEGRRGEEDDAPRGEEPADGEPSPSRGRHSEPERTFREPISEPAGEVLDFISKPPAKEAPAVDPMRGQARIKRRRR